MFPFKRSYFILFMVFSTVYMSTSTFAAPLSNAPNNPYDSFIEYLVKSNCSMPSVAKLPFSKPDDTPFSYLSNPLKECQTPDALKDSDEAKTLCSEIFDALQNITCVEYKTSLPEIQSELLSEDVCKDFKIKHIDFPKKTEYLSWRLVDPLLCKFLCAAEKYNLLCQTLLWSYDLQIKIKSALKGTEGNNLNNSDLGKKSSPGINVNLVTIATDSPKQKSNDNKAGGSSDGNVQPSGNSTTTKKEAFNNLETASSNDKTVVRDPLTVNNQKGNSLMVSNTTEALTGKKELKHGKEDLKAGESDETLQGNPENQEEKELQAGIEITSNKNDNDNSVNSHPETVAVEASSVMPEGEEAKNSVLQNQQPLADSEEAVINPLSGNNIDNLATKVSVVSQNKSKESNSEKNVDDKQKSTSNATKSNDAVVNVPSNDNAVSGDTENELSNVNLDGQENESKVEESNLKTTDDGKKAEKPVLTDLESPIGLGSETDAKPTESATLELLPEEEEHQAEKDPDPYNDNESEDYAKSDYGNSFDPFLKNKEDIKNSDLEGPNPIVSNYGTFKSRNNIGRVPDDGPLISAFPEQEDSHFFFYFLSFVLILMAGYLIFHNKQKIIALIVEGRHERRRRSHGSGYKKLETK